MVIYSLSPFPPDLDPPPRRPLRLGLQTVWHRPKFAAESPNTKNIEFLSGLAGAYANRGLGRRFWTYCRVRSGLLELFPHSPSTAHNPKRCVVMARATFRLRLPDAGFSRPLLAAAAARSCYNNPNGLGSISPPSQPIPRQPVRLMSSTGSITIDFVVPSLDGNRVGL